MNSQTKPDSLFRKNGINYLLSFIMTTICFAMWGFANDVTNPMVKNLGTIFQISKFQMCFVVVATYGFMSLKRANAQGAQLYFPKEH